MAATQADQFRATSTTVKDAVNEAIHNAIRALPDRSSIISYQARDEGVLAEEIAKTLRDRDLACIESLLFPVIEDREESISRAELETFEWIFKDSSFGFKKWLADDTDIYWYVRMCCAS